MQPHGNDLVIATPLSAQTQVQLVTRYLTQLWGSVLLDYADGEVLCYPDDAAQQSWEANGRTAENASKMVQLLPRTGRITIVREGLCEAELRENFAANRDFA